MTKMIFAGGLGNQMFEYALYEELRHQKRNILIDLGLYDHLRMHNGYELDRIFVLDAPHYARNAGKLHITWLRLLLKYAPDRFLTKEKAIPPTLAELQKNRAPYLFGYWQSESYFPHVREKLQREFTFRDIDPENQQKAQEIQQENSVSLHIRRGDYQSIDLYANCCTPDYYRCAIDYIQHVVDRPVFHVFSDDLTWSRDLLGQFSGTFIFEPGNVAEKSYQDMFLMSQCKHNVIANSSFSWWGAWLNRNPQKKVIAPSQWLQAPPETYKHIVPNSWIKM